ncbi:hypothetical protein BCh11DRAFT_05682 [Burkholderia sp. Ch1-1]|uniref:hypothetical protein n=1 Tax=Paraburkholderia sp. USG1 TaxID=2952268 RepID=UPI0001D23D5B|nr:hypothetical protein BCh11DRAFT_05682 [Burkholderia sp. Ch1-1]
MRPVFRIDLSRIAPHAALCTAIALPVLPIGINAQEGEPAQSAMLAQSTDAAPAASHAETIARAPSSDTNTPAAAAFRQLAVNALNIAAEGISTNDFSLDDQALSRQRRGAVGGVMVAATPQLMRGNSNGGSVTLWDEIAPPSPSPIPVDAARAAQGNLPSYQRK